MKITIDINGQSTEIELTKEQVASIEAQAKPKKFEWKYAKLGYSIFRVADTCIQDMQTGEAIPFIEHGRYRLSKEVAAQSLYRNRRANRIEALAEQLGGLIGWQEDQNVGYVYYNGSFWTSTYGESYFAPERIYMTKECATEICRMLNEGEFSVDGEV